MCFIYMRLKLYNMLLEITFWTVILENSVAILTIAVKKKESWNTYVFQAKARINKWAGFRLALLRKLRRKIPTSD